MPSRISLALALHNHQPVGNFGWVFAEVFEKAYEPMVDALERHPGVRLSLHYTGPLLQWLIAERGDTVARLRTLVDRDQVEILGGGYFEPVLASLPERDRIGQLRRMADELEGLFGRRPRGAWLAERVWEPDLPTSLVAAGYEWTVLDDAHFRAAAIPEEDLWGPYTTEDQGHLLRVFGTEQGLRYRIPFRDVEDVIEYLRSHATETGDRVGVMGDDGEKFGAWPTTWEHCWGERRWVDRFFTALEANADWLTTTTPSAWLAEHPPIGRVYIPTGSRSKRRDHRIARHEALEPDAARDRHLGERLHHRLDRVAQVAVAHVEREDAGVDPRQVEQVRAQPLEPTDLLGRALEELAPGRLVDLAVSLELGVHAQRGDRRPKLVADVGDELAQPIAVRLQHAQGSRQPVGHDVELRPPARRPPARPTRSHARRGGPAPRARPRRAGGWIGAVTRRAATMPNTTEATSASSPAPTIAVRIWARVASRDVYGSEIVMVSGARRGSPARQPGATELEGVGLRRDLRIQVHPLLEEARGVRRLGASDDALRAVGDLDGGAAECRRDLGRVSKHERVARARECSTAGRYWSAKTSISRRGGDQRGARAADASAPRSSRAGSG